MTVEDLITRLGVISVSVFTIGRLHGLKELENLSMQMNELADDISRYDWHTGTPTEEGWYVLCMKRDDTEYFYITYYRYEGADKVKDVVAWMPMTPYQGEN